LSDLLSPIRDNFKIIIIAALIAVMFAVIVGVALGMRGRRSEKGSRSEEQVRPESNVSVERDAGDLLIPPPLLPRFPGEEEAALSYLDRHPEFIDEIELRETRSSELIQHRSRGVEADVKPFRFMGEELEILTYENELMEP
jgi:hypothetical protein